MTATGATESARQRRRQRARINALGISAASYALDTLWLLLFWVADVLPLMIPVAYGALTALTCGVVLIVYLRGWSRRLADPSLTLPQTTVGYALQIAGLVFAPQVGVFFLMNMLIVSAFGALTMSVRKFAWSWLVVGAATGVVILLVGERLAVPSATVPQQMLTWFVFVTGMVRIIYLSMWVGGLRDKLAQRNAQLRLSIERVELLASVDELTQVWNRRTVDRFVDEEAQRAARSGGPFCIAMLDLDHFKAVNDTWGHPVGDQVLKLFAATAAGTVRAIDKLGRYGGEEFVLLLPGTPLDGGLAITERVRARVEAAPWSDIKPGLAVTVSAGVALGQAGEPLADLMARCDAALYEAKHAGRNRVAAWRP